MLTLGTKTNLNPEEVIKQAIDFFGPNGYKLEIQEQSQECAYFIGGGGGVDVTTCVEEGKTSVDVSSREWDFQIKEFLGKIG